MVLEKEDLSSYEGDEDYTKITFIPEFKRFGMRELEDDMFELFKKRTWDLAGVVGKKISVYFNDKKVGISSFKDYCSFYMKGFTQKESVDVQVAYMNQPRWELMVGVSQGDFFQVSFVNSIATTRGGTHVDYVVNKVCEGLAEEAQKKCKKKLKIKNSFIKSSIFIILNCQIENPAFDSQTKETLNTKAANFGSHPDLNEKFFKDLIKTGVIDQIVLQAQMKEEIKMQKQLKGVKKNRLFGINKLEDANKAGTKESLKCTLILTEGDSAKALAMAGLEVIGRDYFGVFPLRGKFLNVREASNESILKNAEVSAIIEIMGLSVGKKYKEDENMNALRYGSIMIMADQDHDGSHIKGLIINFIHHFWPDLIRNNNFLTEFVTPIIKVSKGNQIQSFFTINDFKNWAEARVNNLRGWKVKYYKGLGTSDDKEAKEYFSSIDIHKITFKYEDNEDDQAVDLAFNKKKADDRKDWLARFDPLSFVDHNIKRLRYYDFIHKELIQFSIANNQRAIPHLCDGMKNGQRKILYACFKKNLTKELKVAQLAGYVAEHTEYHHGEQNLADTIIGMAQTYVGSNNINLLMPNGQFGTRAMGGKDAASARYLHTCLNKVTRFIFLEEDDHVLNYIEEDGKLVEPTYYIPIIPMALVNGCEGIGTGWSTSIPNFNPRELVENIKEKLEGRSFFKIHPFYKGYNGEITLKDDEKGYIVRGNYVYQEQANQIDILELPILKWTSDYKRFIEEIIQEKSDVKTLRIDDLREYHTARQIFFRLILSADQGSLEDLDLDKILKLTGSLSLNNLVMFNEEGRIKRFENPLAILEQYYTVRLRCYTLRKEYQISKIERDIEVLTNKMRFIQEVNDDKVVISKRKKADIVDQLKRRNFTPQSKLPAIKSAIENSLIALLEKQNQEAEHDEQAGDNPQERRQSAPVMESSVDLGIKEYNYLLSMQILNLGEDQIEKMAQEIKDKEKDLQMLKRTTEKEMWIRDLDRFLIELDKAEKLELAEIAKDDKKAKKPPPADGNVKPKKKKKVLEDEEWEKDDRKTIEEHTKKGGGKQTDDKPKKILKIKGTKDGKGLPIESSTSNNPFLDKNKKPKPPTASTSTTADLDKIISMSQINVFNTSDVARDRLRKVVSLTLQDLEKMDPITMSLEEKIYMKELREGAFKNSKEDGFFKDPARKSGATENKVSQITSFFKKKDDDFELVSDDSEDAFKRISSRRKPKFMNESDDEDY